MTKLLTGQDVIDRYDELCVKNKVPALSGKEKYATILHDIASSEESYRRERSYESVRSLYPCEMNKIYLNWVTGLIATGGEVKYIHKADERAFFRDYLGSYRIALPGQVIVPEFGSSSHYYFVMPGDREKFRVLEGESHNCFLYLDDFSVGAEMRGWAYIPLPYSISKDIVGPVGKERLWKRAYHVFYPKPSLNQNPPTERARILIKAGVDLDVLRQCVKTGEDAHLVKAEKPLPFDDPDLTLLRESAKEIVQRAGQTLEKLCPDGVQYVLPPEVAQDEEKAREVFMLIYEEARKEPRAIAWNLLKDALEKVGVPLFMVGDFPARPLGGPAAAEEETKLTPS